MSTVEEFPLSARRPTEFEALIAVGPSVLDAIPGAVYICDHRGLLVSYNSEAAKLWGRSPNLDLNNELFCGSHRMFLPNGRALRHEDCPMALAVRSGEDCRNAEVVIERPDGTRVTALVNIRPLRDHNGRIQGAINCFQDISAHKRLEDRLREGERQMRDILEALPAAVYTTDATGRITFFNKASVEMAGRTPQPGDEWCVTWKLDNTDGSPLPHDQCPMAIALREQRPVRGAEAIAERPDGTRVSFIPFPTPLHDAEGKLIGAINMLVDISERKQAENRQRILIDELNHRVKNTLATVQSLAGQTARNASSVADFVKKFDTRLFALARAHDLLSKRHWEDAPLDLIVRDLFSPLGATHSRRIEVNGPSINLSTRTALSLTMAINELITNAVKYGALSTEGGKLTCDWRVHDNGALEFMWQERGGPPLAPPERTGFGTRLIERCIRGELRGELDAVFDPKGFSCRFIIPRDCAEHASPDGLDGGREGVARPSAGSR